MKRKIIRDQINQAHQFAINVLGETIELLNAKKELVKAETEMERVKKSTIAPGRFAQSLLSRNMIAHFEAQKGFRHWLENPKFVVSESTAQSCRDLNARMKALEDQVRNFKVKEESKPEEPEMRLVEGVDWFNNYLAISKQDSSLQIFGNFVGVFEDKINLKYNGEDRLIIPNEWHFFKVVTSEAKEEVKPEPETKPHSTEKAWLIKKLESSLEDFENLCNDERAYTADMVFKFTLKKDALERLINELKQ